MPTVSISMFLVSYGFILFDVIKPINFDISLESQHTE